MNDIQRLTRAYKRRQITKEDCLLQVISELIAALYEESNKLEEAFEGLFYAWPVSEGGEDA